MSAATPAEAARYRGQVEELKRQYGAGLVRAQLVSLATSGGSLYSLVYRELAGKSQAEVDLETARQRLAVLESRYLPWALAGERENGTPYARELYQLEVTDISRRIQRVTGEAFEESAWGAALNVPHDTATSVKETVREALAPFTPDGETTDRVLFWLKVGVGVVAFVAVGGTVAKLAGALK